MRFWASVRVPSDAGKGTAKATLSFPTWKKAHVAPATIDLPIVD
jgi:hypothetical protein